MGRSTLFLLLPVVFSLISSFNGFTQKILSESDSIPVTKSKAFKKAFVVNQSLFKELSFNYSKPKPASKFPKKILGDLIEGGVSIAFDIVTHSETEAVWIIENELRADNIRYTWRVPLFCQGTLMKERERVKNEDGS